jgi:hypothetical protein
MVIGDYFRLNYHRLLIVIGGIIVLMDIGGYSIGGYFRLNYHKLLVVISGYYISDYWWLFYSCLLLVILLMTIDGYFIVCHWWLFY